MNYVQRIFETASTLQCAMINPKNTREFRYLTFMKIGRTPRNFIESFETDVSRKLGNGADPINKFGLKC